MNHTIDPELLWKKLSRAKQCKPETTFCSQADTKDTKPDEELRYLIEHAMEPLCRGERVDTRDLDFSRFDRRDIWNLMDFYAVHCYESRCDLIRLRTLYQACCTAVPETKHTCFL